MTVSRRGFLGAMLGAIAVAAAPALAATSQPNKYQKALELYDAAVSARSNPVMVNQRFDTLLTYLMDTFPFTYNDATVDEMARVIRVTKNDEHGWRKIPPDVSDIVYPVALIKMALAHDKLPLHPSDLKAFDRFHAVYGKAVIAASEKRLTMA